MRDIFLNNMQVFACCLSIQAYSFSEYKACILSSEKCCDLDDVLHDCLDKKHNIIFTVVFGLLQKITSVTSKSLWFLNVLFTMISLTIKHNIYEVLIQSAELKS